METALEKAVSNAYASLRVRGITRRIHSHKRRKMLRHVLAKDEQILVEIWQSHIRSLAPAMLVATKKRILMVRPSFWGLHTGHDVISPTSFVIIPYKYIIGVSIAKGLLY